MLSNLPMFTRVGAAALKPGLDNILKMAEALGNPQRKFKSIHVAGTNGKGSTSHSLASVLQAQGYKVGLHTSPHLKRFNERVKINGQEIDDQSIIDFIAKHWVLWQEVKPSFFEYGVLLAFDSFAKAEVDVAVIEVGLGGRLDSTNIIKPILSVITNISFDHVDLLGNSLGAIASEKAGIIKEGVPVVIGEWSDETLPVFKQTSATHRAQLILAESLDELGYVRVSSGSYNLSSPIAGLPDQLEFGLKGPYQHKNLATILTAVKALNDGLLLPSTLTKAAISTGLAHVTELTGLKGRWQIMSKAPLTIVDTGHNEAGLRYISEELSRLWQEKQEQSPNAKLIMVIGMVADKDVKKVLHLLPKKAQYIYCQANIPRALAAEQLAAYAEETGLSGLVIQSVTEAFNQAKAIATTDDIIFVGGSTYVVAELDL